MRFLITGGAGFIGSAFVHCLLADARADIKVTVLDALTYAGDPANLADCAADPRLCFRRGDITDRALVAELMDTVDVVVNFAAETHVDRSITDSETFARTNLLGTAVLLEAAVRAGIRMFVQISTDEVYGPVPRGAVSETAPIAPTSPYAAAKAGADLLALASHRTHGIDVRITRCSNNYGPRQYPEKLIPLFITRLMRGEPVPLYGKGLQSRDWLHVDDHCTAIRLVIEHGRPGQVYNIGGGVELTNREMTALLLAEFGAGEELVEYVPDRKGHDVRYSVDWSKARAELGYRPRRDLRTVLPEVVRWYRENPREPRPAGFQAVLKA